jgi:hypothetical protein
MPMTVSELLDAIEDHRGQLTVLPDRSLRCHGVPVHLRDELVRLQWVVVAITLEATKKKLLAALPETEQDAETCLELARATGQERGTLQSVLRELVTTGIAKRVRAGIRGCAYRYYRAEADGASCE